MAHLVLGIFAHSCKSDTNLSDWEGTSCAQSSPSHPKILNWIQVQTHPKTLVFFKRSQYFVDLEACFELPCSKVKFFSILAVA